MDLDFKSMHGPGKGVGGMPLCRSVIALTTCDQPYDDPLISIGIKISEEKKRGWNCRPTARDECKRWEYLLDDGAVCGGC